MIRLTLDTPIDFAFSPPLSFLPLTSSQLRANIRQRLLIFHYTISLPPQKIPFSKFLMTSLQVICGFGPPPNQKFWLRLCSPATSATTISTRPFILRCSLHCIIRSVFARARPIRFNCDVTRRNRLSFYYLRVNCECNVLNCMKCLWRELPS